MSSSKIDVTFSCKACGASPTELTAPDDATDDSAVTCKNCGVEVGTLREVKEGAKKALVAEMQEKLRKGLTGVKGFKPGR